MPIPNEKFNPGVVSNSAEVRQVIEWIGGRPVPTLAELYATGEYRPARTALPPPARSAPPTTPPLPSPPTAPRPQPAAPAPMKVVAGRVLIRVPSKIIPKTALKK